MPRIELSFVLGTNQKTGLPQWQARATEEGITTLYVPDIDSDVPDGAGQVMRCEPANFTIYESANGKYRIVPVMIVGEPEPEFVVLTGFTRLRSGEWEKRKGDTVYKVAITELLQPADRTQKFNCLVVGREVIGEVEVVQVRPVEQIVGARNARRKERRGIHTPVLVA